MVSLISLFCLYSHMTVQVWGKLLIRLSSSSGSFLSVLSWGWLTLFYPVLWLWVLENLVALQVACLERTVLSICLDTFEQTPVIVLSLEFICLDWIKCQDLQILIHGIRVSSSGNVMIPIPCHSGISRCHLKFMFWGHPNQQNTETGHRYATSKTFAKSLCGGTRVCTSVCMRPHVHAYGGQRWVLGFFLNHSPSDLYIYALIWEREERGHEGRTNRERLMEREREKDWFSDSFWTGACRFS